jgi:hypothetical protein
MTRVGKVFLRWLVPLAVTAVFLYIWLSVGYFYSYSDEEVVLHFFLKAAPTFQVEFHNFDAGESDYEP